MRARPRLLLSLMCFAILALAAAGGPLRAQDLEQLQQRASFAFREMQRAERAADQAAAEAKDVDAQAAELAKQLEATRKRSTQAHARAAQARTQALDARKRWDAAADALDKARPEAKP